MTLKINRITHSFQIEKLENKAIETNSAQAISQQFHLFTHSDLWPFP